MSKTEAICLTIGALFFFVYLLFPEWSKHRLQMAELRLLGKREDEDDDPTSYEEYEEMVEASQREAAAYAKLAKEKESVESKVDEADKGKGIGLPID